MQYKLLLNKNENTRKVIAEEQLKFISSILEILEIPTDFNFDTDFSIEDKVKLRKILNEFSINVIDNMDDSLHIYGNGQLIGEWKKPLFKLKEDIKELDKNKKLYLEMNIDFWTVFEEHGEI